MRLLHFAVLILHCREIDVEKRKKLEGYFTFFFNSKEKTPRLQNNPNPEFDLEPDTKAGKRSFVYA